MDKSVAIGLKVVGFLLIFTAAFVPLYNIKFQSSTAEPDPIIPIVSETIIGVATDIYYSDNYIYITEENTGLQIFNVTEITEPNPMGVYGISGDAKGVYVDGEYAYVVDTDLGLSIINVSDVNSPTYVSSYSTGGANEVVVKDNYAYVADNDVGFLVLNTTDVTTPTHVSNYSIANQVNKILVKDGYAYVVDSGMGLHIIDVTDPTNLNLIGTFETFGSANDVYVVGQRAYVVGENIGLQIVNITSPANPELWGSYDTQGEAFRVFERKSFVYVLDTEGLKIIDAINATEPILSESYQIENNGFTFVVHNFDTYLLTDLGLEIFKVRPQFNTNNSGTLARVLAFKVDYKLLSFNTAFNRTDATYQTSEVPSSITILSSALWFILVFAILATVLGQVFQGGGFKKRGTVADIAAALLYLCGLIAGIIAMNRTLYIVAEKYQAVVLGQFAQTPLDSPITFNPNDQNPAYFIIKATGSVGPGFYLFIIGILTMVTGIFLPVDWKKPVGSKMVRKAGETGVIKWIKNIATLRLTTYITRRLLTLIPLFIAICVLTFVMVSGMGDPVALLLLGKQRATEQDRINLTRKLGLDQPVYVQFIMWFYNLLQGDMGNSFTSGQAINGMIGGLIWETLKLQLAAYFFALIISIPLGIIAAKNQNTWIDSFASSLALLGQSMPIFVFGLVLIYIFSGYGLGWFPAAKAHKVPVPTKVFSNTNWNLFWSGQWGSWWGNVTERLADSILHMALPTVTLLFNFMALYTRLVRSTMLEVLRQDYILAARANGIAERKITWKHAFRNTLIPVVTYVGLFLATALAGAPITETLFTWPGLGFKYVQAIGFLDFPMILGTTALLTILILIGNLLTDIAYVAVDPRIEL